MDLMKLMKQAQEMQAKMQRLQEELAAQTVTGEAGGGLVRLSMTGKGALTGVQIDRTLLNPDEGEILEDLLLAAHRDAQGKVQRMTEEAMKGATAGLPLPPGMKLF